MRFQNLECKYFWIGDRLKAKIIADRLHCSACFYKFDWYSELNSVTCLTIYVTFYNAFASGHKS